ncbi:MAG: MBL fold metallo-hydrolase [Acidobacteriales bacterium]|nr:MBL fold metallo-hydrolase [Terriglobales bacterium]
MPDSYLRSDTLVEPLQCGWYAWAHTIAPVQYGFNLAQSQLPLLSTFVANPSAHEAAHEDAGNISGPFVNLASDAVPAVQALMAATTQKCQPIIDFSEAVHKFEKHLRTTALGFSLDPTYTQAPPALAGFVEASYDLHNRPQLRVLEELLYRSPLSGASTQQMSLVKESGKTRRFFLNTPRLPSPGRIILDIPFNDPRWEKLAKSRIAPVSVPDLAEELGVPQEQRELFGSLFSPEPPQRNIERPQGDAVRVRYFGHACILIESADTSILVDGVFASIRDEGAAKLTFDDLPDHIDYVFLTHAHADHFSMENLLKLRGRVGTVLVPRNNPINLADPSMRLIVRALGFTEVRAMDQFDEIALPRGGRLMSLPFLGEHSDLTIHSKHTLHLSLNGRSLLFLADSACADPVLYDRVSEVIGPVDVMFIGMECDGAPLTWLYGHCLTNRPSRKMDDSRKLSGCNAEQAWTITKAVAPKRTYVYAMGQEPWMTFLMGLAYTPQSIQITESDDFVARCNDGGIPSERLFGAKELSVG